MKILPRSEKSPKFAYDLRAGDLYDLEWYMFEPLQSYRPAVTFDVNDGNTGTKLYVGDAIDL